MIGSAGELGSGQTCDPGFQSKKTACKRLTTEGFRVQEKPCRSNEECVQPGSTESAAGDIGNRHLDDSLDLAAKCIEGLWARAWFSVALDSVVASSVAAGEFRALAETLAPQPQVATVYRQIGAGDEAGFPAAEEQHRGCDLFRQAAAA